MLGGVAAEVARGAGHLFLAESRKVLPSSACLGRRYCCPAFLLSISVKYKETLCVHAPRAADRAETPAFSDGQHWWSQQFRRAQEVFQRLRGPSKVSCAL